MINITKKQWLDIHNDYKGTFEDVLGIAPHLKGKKFVFLGSITKGGGTALAFEGIDFTITE